ncbi:hypothetical protein SAMN06297251_11130 [Fulvimarina manganoxydans]|uniref:Uncharacterized protein n=1 Tax=Fulvimarina manganoxydans TaxID=937218 RepID=A0A1W2CRC3_9HYPH|nr:hypothetical protein SAMN06297251_11130 [Fulvimarina manganoxydans]
MFGATMSCPGSESSWQERANETVLDLAFVRADIAKDDGSVRSTVREDGRWSAAPAELE